MGIQGLLPLLKSIHKPCNLKKFAGQTLGVDAYGWLHRGTVACAIELAQGKYTTKFVDFAMNRVRMLIHFGVTPYIVFDGDYLPSKSGTEKDRAARRRESKKTGLELLRMGRTAQAQLELQKAVDVTPEMARQLIDELKKANVAYVVAPYEADAQLAYLERTGVVDGILSEDSDLLVFGAKCLLTKLDQYGDCIMIRRDDFTACREISLVGWSDEEFRWMAILNGCDYLPGIDKMGLKTAYRLIRKHKNIERLIRAVQFDGKMKVPPGYLEAFKKAEEAFLYQWAFCPEARELVNLTKPEVGDDLDSMPHIGKHVDRSIAIAVAQGYVHPHTKEPLAAPVKPQTDLRTAMRRSMTQETPNLKKHQSIESFFKPRRTPLAELDPNSFTPSPSQQRLLEQQQEGSWSAEPIQARPAFARASTGIVASQPTRRALSDLWPASASKSPKRQRMCSDNSIGLAMSSKSSLATSTSKFFSSKPHDSPSLRKGNRSKDNSQQDVNIWSDDSIEEAMSQMPDVEKSTVKSKKIAVFKEEALPKTSVLSASPTRSHVDPISQDTNDTQITGASSTAISQSDTPDTSVASESQLFSQDIQETLHAPELGLTSLSRKHALQEAKPEIAEESVGFTGKESSAEEPADSADIVPCSSPAIASGFTFERPKTAGWNSDNADIQDSAQDEWLLTGEQPLRPLSILEEIGSQSNHKGSEDQLVPDSEGEEDAPRRPSFGLDIGRFAFTG